MKLKKYTSCRNTTAEHLSVGDHFKPREREDDITLTVTGDTTEAGVPCVTTFGGIPFHVSKFEPVKEVTFYKSFLELSPGDVFDYLGDLYVKVGGPRGATAVTLPECKLVDAGFGWRVKPCSAELRVGVPEKTYGD